MRILLVEDEPNIARPVLRALEAQGHTVVHADTMQAARQHLTEDYPYDLLLLDIMLPGDPDGGFTLAQEALDAGFSGRILYLTARDGLDDRVRGLDSGDDYLVKPFDLPELLARVRALLRRDTPMQASRFGHGPLVVDFATREAHWQGRPVILTRKEYSLLERFVLQPQRIYSVTELHDLVWSDASGELSVVRQAIHRLRTHLAPEVIETVPSGYRLGTFAG